MLTLELPVGFYSWGATYALVPTWRFQAQRKAPVFKTQTRCFAHVFGIQNCMYIYIICIFHIFHRYAEVDMKCHDLLILCIEHPGTWPEQLAGFCGDCCDGGLSIAQWCSDSPNANAAGCGYTLHRIMWFRNMISTWLVMLLVYGLWLGIY